ncbi:MAG: hypothetical protein LBP83_09305 [Dysgonamonadaceae bacterium]|jgi:hypothetical protein|nr:hypothetical protein [Dysgonamonadaceae bacterium]
MLTKEYITELKHRGEGDIAVLVKAQRDVGAIVFILESLGQLPENFQELDEFFESVKQFTRIQEKFKKVVI